MDICAFVVLAYKKACLIWQQLLMLSPLWVAQVLELWFVLRLPRNRDHYWSPSRVCKNSECNRSFASVSPPLPQCLVSQQKNCAPQCSEIPKNRNLAQVRFCSLLEIVCCSVMHAGIRVKGVPGSAVRISLPRRIMKPVIGCSYFGRDSFKVMGHFFWLTLYIMTAQAKTLLCCLFGNVNTFCIIQTKPDDCIEYFDRLTFWTSNIYSFVWFDLKMEASTLMLIVSLLYI